ncbi:MAG: ROK family protein [Anaerolineales bacterium]|nr:ROK family protein [Anaerolineales bacterium]
MGQPQYIIGIDLGATNARVGLISTNGKALDIQAKTLPTPRKPETGLQTVIELTRLLLNQYKNLSIVGIGAGVTGPVDRLSGTVINPYTEPAWQYTPFTEPLHETFDLPVVLENDADSAALGEYWQGNGRGAARLYVVTIGTGIGTSFIDHGKVYRGLDGSHPEGGHHIIDISSGVHCYCGMVGCWESLASGEAFQNFARRKAAEERGWLKILSANDIQDVNTPAVIQAAQQGDQIALQLVQQEGYYLGVGLLNIISMFMPDKIILCGGMARYFDLFEPAIREVIADHRYMVPAESVVIQTDSLDYYAGVYGAAYAFLISQQESA